MSVASSTVEPKALRELTATSWYEASARQRISGLLDIGSFEEFIGPASREISPHLALFNVPEQFDDGIIVGRGQLGGNLVWVAAQEGQFMGGAFGEVHGAKLTGLLRAARDLRSSSVVLLLDTGGVRLQEANVGELAISEIMRAILEARLAGVPVVGMIGGRAGCYGGGSLIAGCCSALAISEQGRLSVSGPEVIETNSGVDEFDSKDRATVWRTMGGKNRRLLGAVDSFLDDTVVAFREAAMQLIKNVPAFDGTMLDAEQARLECRLERYGRAEDALDIWRALGSDHPESIPGLSYTEFLALADRLQEPPHEAR
jgi:malonate decarboxylase beta subunit